MYKNEHKKELVLNFSVVFETLIRNKPVEEISIEIGTELDLGQIHSQARHYKVKNGLVVEFSPKLGR